jgi:hypothetical protein
MKSKAIVSFLSLLAGLSLNALASGATLTKLTVANLEDILSVEQVIGNTADAAAEPIEVRVLAGTYTLRDSFRIARSHVSLVGEPGAKFVLADGMNEPVIAIGSQVEAPGAANEITDIVIIGLSIDGNKENQSSECGAVLPWIRNNGIDVRAVTHLTVDNVTSSNNRSGGLVISWGCSDIRVSNSTFATNYYDGIACYASTGVDVVDCTMKNNRGAGVSLDNAFVDSRFFRCVMDSNGDVGIFARSSARLEFKDCVVKHSGNWAYFLAHDPRDRGVVDISITGGQVVGNRGGVCVASVNEQQSHGTRVTGTFFSDNGSDNRKNIQTSGSLIDSTKIVESDPLSKLAPLNVAAIH